MFVLPQMVCTVGRLQQGSLRGQNRDGFRSSKIPAGPLVPRTVPGDVDCLEGTIKDPQNAMHAARARPFSFSELDDLFFGNNLDDLSSASRSPPSKPTFFAVVKLLLDTARLLDATRLPPLLPIADPQHVPKHPHGLQDLEQ